MARMPLRTLHSGWAWLCLAAPGLLLIPSAEAADTNTPGPKPSQVISVGPPPLAPTLFDPDPNPLQFPPIPWATTNWSRRVFIDSNAPPAAPPQFNPDPGASLAPPPSPPAPLLFPGEFIPKQPFVSPMIQPEHTLPRSPLRRGELVPPVEALPQFPTEGTEPLPDELKLPREKTRRNLRIDQTWHPREYSLSSEAYPTNTQPRPDRWRIGFTPWKRYTSGVTEQPYASPAPLLWHPYRQSVLKGDAPILGQDIFLNLTASSQTELEFRRLPTPSGVSAAKPGAAEFFGDSEQMALQQNFAVSAELFKSEAAFKPVEWALKLEPVFNLNYLNARETGVVSPDPRGSIGGHGDSDDPNDDEIQPAPGSDRGTQHTTRTKGYVALQQVFGELHLSDLSDNYDFIAARVGNQPFNSDFRGFLFNDINLGARLFGNADNNRWQYNAALFDMREKDTYSDLNTFHSRNQQVFIANAYRQDFLWRGYTAQWSLHANLDHGGAHYDRTGTIVRPAPIGTVDEHEVRAYYLGWAGDGHIGWLNLSHAFYQALGRDTFNGLAGRPVDINAQMAALELSVDRDWVRYKASLFYASGDSETENGTGQGFDTILDNPNFTGGPFSYWTRQGFNLAGTLVNLKQRGSLVPNLRTSKTQGQANFVNPGVFIGGLGTELDVLPKLRAFLNANYVRMIHTEAIQTALLTDQVNEEIGWDLSLGVQYRPLLTDNIILSAGFGVLIPGRGFKDIYRANTDPVPGFDRADRPGQPDGFLYSGLFALTFVY